MKGKTKKFIVIVFLALIASKFAYVNPQEINYQSKVNLIREDVKALENSDYDTNTLVENEELESTSKGVGVLEIPNSGYSTVIMQGDDNKYYLNHDEDGNKKSDGVPFLDYRVNIDTSRKLIIYGHSSRYSDMPFNTLENYYNEDYYNKHKIIILKTKKEKYKYEIFSVYTETSDWGYTKVGFKTLKEYLDHINELASRSIYKSDIKLTEKDKILILQTCSTNKDYKKYKKKYLLVIGRKVD